MSIWPQRTLPDGSPMSAVVTSWGTGGHIRDRRHPQVAQLVTNSVEPRNTCPRTLPVYCVPRTVRRRECLRTASARVGAVLRCGHNADGLVLARCSAPERVRSAVPTAPDAERGSLCFPVGAGGLRAC